MMHGAERSGIVGAVILVFPGVSGLVVMSAETKMTVELWPLALAPDVEELVYFETYNGPLGYKRNATAFNKPDGGGCGHIDSGFL